MFLEYDKKGTGVKVTREKGCSDQGTLDKQNLSRRGWIRRAGGFRDPAAKNFLKGARDSKQDARAQAKIEY